MTIPAIEARDVFRVYSAPDGQAAALQGLSLTVAEREVVTILGPSGSGKTSLLRILAGLDQPSAGTARVFGENLATLRGRSLIRYRDLMLGYVVQDYAAALAPELTARELVALKLRLLGASTRERMRRAEELLERVGLGRSSRARPPELSGGEQQRVAVCAALVHRPRLLLADEPTGELDAESAGRVYAAILDLARGEGCTVVIVSHDPASAAIADRTVRVRDGRVSEEAKGASGDGETIVVGRGGWLRVPDELLDVAGITSHAVARAERRTIVISAAMDGARGDDGDERTSIVQAPTPPNQFDGVPVRGVGVGKTHRSGAGEVRVLDSLNAMFEPARFHVVTGPSGSGKTTLLHLIAGLELPTEGIVEVGDWRLSELDRETRAELRRRHLALVGQRTGLIPFLSARENVELALRVRGGGRGEDHATDALAAVGLAERSEQRVSRLSSGEQQRVAVARAIAARPGVLIADEPTARLDLASAHALATLLDGLARNGMTVICATHDPLITEQADAELPLIAPVAPRRG